MAILTIQGTGTDDTYLFGGDTNFNGNGNVSIGEPNDGSGITAKTLIKFDFTSIPAGSVINSASLTLYVAVDKSDNERTMLVNRLLQVWVEDEATFNIYSTGNNWDGANCTTAGVDFEAASSGSATQPANPSEGDAVVVTLTASKVQGMITGGGFTNNGFVLAINAASDDMIQYHDSEQATAAKRPKLVVDYTPPGGKLDLTSKYW